MKQESHDFSRVECQQHPIGDFVPSYAAYDENGKRAFVEVNFIEEAIEKGTNTALYQDIISWDTKSVVKEDNKEADVVDTYDMLN